MLKIKSFTFNFAGENTYLTFTESKKAWLIDPGNMNSQETSVLSDFILENGLKIEKILLTHAHIDHILGLQGAVDTFKLPVTMHELDKEILDMYQISGMRFGFELPHIKADLEFVSEGDTLSLDDEHFSIYHVPGHSPGSIVFHNKKEKIMISGDVLFEGSIGRTDLFNGNYDQLIEGIKTKLLILDENTKVFSGHGNPTTICFEKQFNPFLKHKKPSA